MFQEGQRKLANLQARIGTTIGILTAHIIQYACFVRITGTEINLSNSFRLSQIVPNVS